MRQFKGDDAKIAWDLDMISQSARAVAEKSGRVAYDAYALDLFRAGDRHMSASPPAVAVGFWWASSRSTGELVIIEVFTHSWQEPDDEGYGDLQGFVMRHDYCTSVEGQHGLKADYNFICKIPEPAQPA